MKQDEARQMAIGGAAAGTRFVSQGGRLWLASLGGMATGRGGEEAGPARAQGMAVLGVDGRRYEAGGLALESMEHADDALNCRWRAGTTGVRLTARWQGFPETGIVSRRDTLANEGDAPVTISRCLARVTLPPGRYELYYQGSRWCHENQGAWIPLHAGEVTLRHAWGRTTEEGTPYLAVRPVGGGGGLAFHVLPVGNWVIRVTAVNEGGERPYAVIELGLADENLHRVLQPGESLDLPEILVQPLQSGLSHLGAPALHCHLLAHTFADAKPEAPVIYNTWFHEFELLDVPSLRAQLATAREIGCEAFVVDAGWYGAGASSWWQQAGDWREKTTAAFCGHMREFADEVRAAGLGFGLWMEPERFGPDAPIRAEHPEWFVPVGAAARLDLTQPAAYTYLRSEILRLVTTYRLAWMKLDFNFTFDDDASGGELHDYAAAWYRLLDEVRAACPQTFFEGCSSGAMRGDLSTLRHVDGHFLSDTVNPVDMLRISQGAWLRLPPGRLGRWAVVRSAGRVVPRYGCRTADSPAAVLVPCGAGWEPSETEDLSFALMVAMPGMLGFSGDLAGLAPEHRTQIAQGIGFYRKWRRFIAGSMAYLLTPPEPLESREGWIAVQLQRPGDDTSLVFVYRLGVCGAAPRLALCGLRNEVRYTVSRGFDEAETGLDLTGAELASAGLPLPPGCPPAGTRAAEVLIVRAHKRPLAI